MAASRLSELPDEILRPILLGAAGKRADLAPLRLVSKRFDELVNAELWRTVAVKNKSRLLTFVKALQKTPAIGAFVRTLTIDTGYEWEINPNLSDLKVDQSVDWLAENYSPTFVAWFSGLFGTGERSIQHAIILSIAHLPKLEHLACSLRNRQEQRLLLNLFNRCKTARLRELGLAGSNSATAKEQTPLMHLTRAGLFNKHVQEPLSKHSSIILFPLDKLQIHRPAPQLFMQRLQPDLQDLEIKNMIFHSGTLGNILTAFPSLKRLTYGAWVMPLFEQTGSVLDLDAAGNTLRQLGRNLRHLNLFILLEDDDPRILRGSIGSLQELESLWRSRQGLAPEHAAGVARDARPHYLGRCNDFPSLVGVRIDWIPEKLWRVSGWDRGMDEEWMWFTRSGAGSRAADRLNGSDMMIRPDPSEDWGAEYEDQQALRAASRAS
ncbi:uncharacterized protein B0I36DRAFT_398285 [Microdochium trichocladiopsis]|uniref:F-box domain-containing protein n=1 Tax=Microdochium trichocladiopsis TaxID=1682393 RepID=A0A9P8XSM4_9PEZI|nr:uncharacterized protein B0I36DRAFT_398285 [Microdochium trichocladiopsis]KAH7014516.1 hypothetical protein B0I36DRAFT_398285 [Microdochium trichocladiopsis]